MQFDVLDYAVYVCGKHVADFDSKEEAVNDAHARISQDNPSTCVIFNLTGEVVATFDIVHTITIKEWVARD